MEKCANERRTAKREERKDHEKRALAESLVQEDTAAMERAPKSIPHENEKAAGDDGRKREGR